MSFLRNTKVLGTQNVLEHYGDCVDRWYGEMGERDSEYNDSS